MRSADSARCCAAQAGALAPPVLVVLHCWSCMAVQRVAVPPNANASLGLLLPAYWSGTGPTMLSTEWQRIAQYAQLLPITYVSAPIHNSTPTKLDCRRISTEGSRRCWCRCCSVITSSCCWPAAAERHALNKLRDAGVQREPLNYAQSCLLGTDVVLRSPTACPFLA